MALVLKDRVKVLANTTGKYQLLCANCNQIKRVENGELGGRKREVA